MISAEPDDSRFQQLIDERAQLLKEFRAKEESDSGDDAIAIVERLVGVERKLAADLGQPQSAPGQQLRFKVLDSLGQTLTWLASRYAAREQFERAIKMRQELVTLRSGLLGENHPQTIDTRVALMDLESRAKLTDDQREELAQADRLHDEAIRSLRDGQLQRALELEQQVLRTCQKLLGDEAPLVGASHQHLGLYYQRAGDFERAAQHLRTAERLRRRFWGRNHPEWRRTAEALADVLGGLSKQALNDDRMDDAGHYSSQRLTILLDRHGATDWRVIDAIHEVADISRLRKLTPDEYEELSQALIANREAVALFQKQEYVKAEETLRKGLATREKIWGRDHPNTITMLSNLAHALKSQQLLDEAGVLFREIVHRRRRNQGIRHPRFRESQKELVKYLKLAVDDAKQKRDFDAALEMQREALQLSQAVYGANDHRVTDARLEIADIEQLVSLDPEKRDELDRAKQLNLRAVELDGQGRPHEAIPLAQTALEIRRRVLGEEHPDYAIVLINLASFCESTGDIARAETTHLQAKAIQEQVLGKEHPDYADSLSNLADLYCVSGDYGRAETLNLQAKAIRERAFGKEHKDYANSLNQLAELYRETGRFQRAETLLLEAIAIQEKVLGKENLDLASSLNKLALVSLDSGDPVRAERLFLQAQAIREKTSGKQHPIYANSLNNLATLYQQTGDYKRAETMHLEAQAIWENTLGKEHPNNATTLNNLALLYKEMGEYSRAEPLHFRAKAIREKVYGKEHPDYATSLDNLAGLYHVMGNYSRAEPLMIEGMAIRERTIGKKHPLYATSVNNLATLYSAMGDHQRAERLYLQAKTICEKVFGKNHPQYATSLYNLASLYESMGDYARAESLIMQAKMIREKVLGKNHPDYAVTLSSLAVLYKEQGRFAQAESMYVDAKEIHEKQFDKEHPAYVTNLNNLALLYGDLGDSDRAEALHAEALAIQARLHGKEHPGYALSLNNLARLYESKGDYARAEPLYLRAKAIREKKLGKNHPHYAITLNNLAGLYRVMGDYTRAESLQLEAQAIQEKALGKEHPHFAASLNNLAELYRDMGNHARVEQLLIQANAILEKSLGKDHPHYALNLNNLARTYAAQRDYTRAQPLYAESKAIQEQLFGKDHPYVAICLINLARLHENLGDNARAESLYLEAKAIQEKVLGREHPDYAGCLNNLASFYFRSKDYHRAQEHFKAAVDITLKHLDKTAYILSERQQMLMNQSLRYQLDNCLLCCLVGDLDPQDAIARIVAWKGSILLRQRRLRLAADDPAIAEPFRKLQSLAMQLSSTISAIPPHGQVDDWKRRIDSLTEEKETLEAELMRDSAAFRAGTQKVSLHAIRQAIPSDAVLIDYLEYGHQTQRLLLASIIRPKGEMELIDLGSAGSVSRAIDTWRQSYGMTPEAREAGRELQKQIWQPLEEQVNGAELILISTDGVLGKLPFAALPGSQPDSYLIEEHRIALIPVPQLLPALVSEQGGKPLQRELLLLGDVDYDMQPNTKHQSADDKDKPARRKRPWERSRNLAESVRGGITWDALNETRLEVEFIAGLYRRLFQPTDDAVLDLRKAEATEDAFRRHAPQCVLLHLATHGFFAAPEAKSALSAEAISESQRGQMGRFDDQPELIRGHSPGQLSGLVFAGANHPPKIDPLAEQTPDDGIMTADEIAFLPLGGVRLAVLSACETGLGEVAGGEGLLGIQRSFQVAGVRTTIASLWKVNDPATRRLMQEFYTNYLDKGMSIVNALRETQLWALNHPGEVPRGASRETTGEAPERLEPQFWAPFVLSGDWR